VMACCGWSAPNTASVAFDRDVPRSVINGGQNGGLILSVCGSQTVIALEPADRASPVLP